MREGFGHWLARLAVGHHRGQLQVRMPTDQPQQLTSHVAGAAEHKGGDRLAHSAAIATAALAPRPTDSITESPSAAGLLIALKAGTCICCTMISTPTWLSVAGPVTTHGSTWKRSRSNFTPPHAATGSFAESTTPVSALRMSSQSRIASTP